MLLRRKTPKTSARFWRTSPAQDRQQPSPALRPPVPLPPLTAKHRSPPDGNPRQKADPDGATKLPPPPTAAVQLRLRFPPGCAASRRAKGAKDAQAARSWDEVGVCVGGVCVTNRVSPLRSGTPAPLTEALPSSSSQLPGAINHPFSTREAPLSPLRPARRRPPSGGGEERRGGKWPPPSAPAEGSTPGPRRKAPSASPLRFRLPSPSRPAPPPHLLRGPGGRSPRQEGGPGAGERRRRRQQPGHRPRQPHGRCRERGGGSGAAPGGRGGRPVGWAEVVWVVSLILGFLVVFFFTVGGCTVCPPVSSASPGDKPGLGSNRTLR